MQWYCLYALFSEHTPAEAYSIIHPVQQIDGLIRSVDEGKVNLYTCVTDGCASFQLLHMETYIILNNDWRLMGALQTMSNLSKRMSGSFASVQCYTKAYIASQPAQCTYQPAAYAHQHALSSGGAN